MDVIKLKSFIAVAKLGNFRKASEELFFSQPAISAQIKELEHYYNVSLFERLSGGKIRLTESGELLLDYAEDLVKKFEESRYSVQNAASAARGRISIGTSILPGLYYLPDMIADFREKHSNITFDISLKYSSDIEKLVLSGNIHLGIIGTPEDFVFDSNLTALSVFRDRLVACVYKDHPLAEKDSVTLAELAEYELIFQPRNTFTRKVVEKSMREKHIPFKVDYEIANNEMIKKMVSRKLGITVLCTSMVTESNSCEELKAIDFEDFHSYRNINIVFRKDRKLSPPLKSFIDFILSHPKKNIEDA